MIGDRLVPGLSNDVDPLTLLRISAIGLKFGRIMHSMMKQIINKMNGYARLISVHSTEL